MYTYEGSLDQLTEKSSPNGLCLFTLVTTASYMCFRPQHPSSRMLTTPVEAEDALLINQRQQRVYKKGRSKNLRSRMPPAKSYIYRLPLTRSRRHDHPSRSSSSWKRPCPLVSDVLYDYKKKHHHTPQITGENPGMKEKYTFRIYDMIPQACLYLAPWIKESVCPIDRSILSFIYGNIWKLSSFYFISNHESILLRVRLWSWLILQYVQCYGLVCRYEFLFII